MFLLAIVGAVPALVLLVPCLLAGVTTAQTKGEASVDDLQRLQESLANLDDVLAALEAKQPAGTYRVVTEEEQIEGLSFTAFRRTATMLHLPAVGTKSGTHQVVTLDPVEWTALVEADEET